MNTPRPRTLGNRIAPVRFLIFLLIFGVSGLLAYRNGYTRGYAMMGGFDLAALVYFVLLAPLIRDGEAASIRRHAAENDSNRVTLLVISALIGLVLMVAIKAEIDQSGDPPAVLIIATLTLAWLFANTLYALHYAHLYYGEGHSKGGLEFPGTPTPDYWDFLYFAFGLGMAFQTADVNITGRTMRRVVLAHCLVAFFFNIGILAFTINTIGASAPGQ
jgi:uncharacterized membrane protein